MTPKQERFCQEYLVDLSLTEAARRAGYKNATRRGWQLMQVADVRERIQQLMDERAQRTAITADRVVEGIARVAFGGLSRFLRIDQETGLVSVRLDGVPAEDLDCLQQVRVTTTTSADGRVTERVEIQVYDRLSALDKLMRHLGGYEDRLKVDGTVGFPGPPPPEVVKLVEEALGRPLLNALPPPLGLLHPGGAEAKSRAGAT